MTGLADAQVGIVRRDQVVGTCLTDAALRNHLESKRWQAVLPSVYAIFTGTLTEQQRLIAATLYATEAQVTGPAALRAYGFRYVPEDPRVHLLVPNTRHLSSTGFVVMIRTRNLDDRGQERDGIRYASVARAVADTARLGHDIRAVRAFVSEAVQRRLSTIADLTAELEIGPRKGSGILRQVLVEVAGGIRSAPEAEFKEIIDTTAGLPRVLWNPRLSSPSGERLPTPDAWIDEVGIAVEVDSREHHADPEGWERTLQRHTVLASHGVLVLHFTPAQIRATPELVRRQVFDAYRARLRDGFRPTVQARDQSVSQVPRTT